MIGDEGLAATDATARARARARARGRTQILQAQKGWTLVRQAQRRSKAKGGWLGEMQDSPCTPLIDLPGQYTTPCQSRGDRFQRLGRQ